jgi:hypothetical protein
MLIEKIALDEIQAPASEEEGVEALKSALIVGYEAAIDRGLPPSQAIAAILEWVAQECSRLGDV